MRRIAMLSIALTLGGTACGPVSEVTANPDIRRADELGSGIAGVYVLRSVAGKTLPTVVTSHESYHAVMLSDTIFLHADGTGAEAAVKRVTEDAPAGERTVWEDGALLYAMEGDRLTLEYICNDVIVFAACAAPPHYVGTVSGNGFRLNTALNSRTPLVFEKVAGPSDVASVQITPLEEITVAAGGTIELSARVFDAQSRPLAGRTVRWHSMLPSAATVNANGVVRGVTEGFTLVMAFSGGRADTVQVRITK